MKIAFVSNYLTHHQIPFSKEMYKRLGVNYIFISTVEMELDRKKDGWEIKENYPFELRAYESSENKKKAINFINECDIVIIGSASDSYIIERLKKNRLTFKYSERFYKKGLNIKTFFRAAIGAWLHHGRFQKYPLCMLCASAYTAYDASIFGNYRNRTFKWGYFPQFIQYDLEYLINEKNNKVIEILWCGRLIDWKHPELPLIILKKLINSGYNCNLTMIGDGYLAESLYQQAKNFKVENNVNFIKTIPYSEVRSYMEKANIFLFTSDFNEGWGAVLNEAMNSACAVVASHAAGSVPFLIEHRKNGLIYRNEDIEDLYDNVKFLIDNEHIREAYGRKAYETIQNDWNAEVAAKRFIKLVEDLSNKNQTRYSNGPCSVAPNIKNDWW